MTTEDLKLTVYHYKDNHERTIIINTVQECVVVLYKRGKGMANVINGELTKDLKWKPLSGEKYSPMDKKILDITVKEFVNNQEYRRSCEKAKTEELQAKIEEYLQKIEDAEQEIKRILG